ncbi:sulfonate ABC transporter substrate-binding protein [Undibacterium sp. SXout7W]|uniref:sulfonate ABC transporter substrate-binding protein n=1 Tax=Undibacterium sp. SXout7W TaxID=3413049 RepID=UPI003BEF4EFA
MKKIIRLLVLCILAFSFAHIQAEEKTIGIGFQKGSGLLSILKSQGTLEKILATKAVKVKWVEFPAGPQLLEALHAGSIDFGLTGAPPPIFAQSAGVDLRYVGAEPSAPASEAIVVRKQSTLNKVTDLKGKKIAFQKGSSSHFLILDVLQKFGLSMSDIQPVYLTPADARAAFVSGSIDAWVIWDPYLVAVQQTLQVRVIADHRGLTPVNSFYEASKTLTEKSPEILNVLLEQLALIGAWSNQHPREVATIIAPQLGLPAEILEVWLHRTQYGVLPMNKEIIFHQQHIADLFFQAKLIPKAVNVAAATWVWKPVPSGK